jgi:hypothetical protein
VATVVDRKTLQARSELQAWYLRGLLPKLAEAARTGTVSPGAIDALDAELRALLGLPREKKEAA